MSRSDDTYGLTEPSQLRVPVIQGVRLNRDGQPAGSRDDRSHSPEMRGGGPSMPNLVRHQSNLQQASVAGDIVTTVDDLLGALAEMYEVNKYWKDKYMQCRSDHVNKYIPTGNSRALEKTFHFWKSYIFTMGSVARLERLKNHLEDLVEEGKRTIEDRDQEHQEKLHEMQQAHEEKLEEFANQLERQEEQCQELIRERDYYGNRENCSGGLLKSMRDLLAQTNEKNYMVDDLSKRDQAGNFEYTRQTLHDILNELDPKYVPPVGSLWLGPPASNKRPGGRAEAGSDNGSPRYGGRGY